MKKTNAARILDRFKIDYELVEYEVDEEDLSAEHLAETAELEIEKVFKTLVLQGDRTGIFVCVIPGGMAIDLKLAATVSGNKKAAMVKMKEIEPLTGYIRGGCSPVGMKKEFPTFIDEAAFEQPFIYVSAGARGLQMKVVPASLAKVCKAKIASIAIEKTDDN